MKSLNEADLMNYGAREQKALFNAHISNLVQRLAHVTKYVSTICRDLPRYQSKLSFGMESDFQELSRPLLESTHVTVLARKRVVESSATEALALFEKVFQLLESKFPKTLPNL